MTYTQLVQESGAAAAVLFGTIQNLYKHLNQAFGDDKTGKVSYAAYDVNAGAQIGVLRQCVHNIVGKGESDPAIDDNTDVFLNGVQLKTLEGGLEALTKIKATKLPPKVKFPLTQSRMVLKFIQSSAIRQQQELQNSI